MSISTTKALVATPRVLARNTLLNLGAQSIVAVTAILLLPVIVKGLGSDAYGLLSLALALFSSLSFLDVGLGRATTKFVAEHLAKGDLDSLGSVIWTSFSTQVMIGTLVGIIIALGAPWMAYRALKISPELVTDAEMTLLILAAAIPIVLASFSLRGALEGAQRLDVVNYIKVGLNLSTYVLPFVGALAGFRIPLIVLLMFGARLASVAAYALACQYVLPVLKDYRPHLDMPLLRRLFSFAGWVAVSGSVVPILVQADRYVVGALVSVASVTYYSLPYELLNGLWIIPGAVAATLFPAFGGMHVRNDAKLAELYARPIKYILMALGPVVILLVLYGGEVLLLWQGADVAEKSTMVLQIMVAGVLMNSLAYVPTSLLLGLGHPDWPAKLGVLELLVYLPFLYVMVARYGVVGAAISFAVRVTVDALLLFAAVWYLEPFTRRGIFNKELRFASGLLLVYMVALMLIHSLRMSLVLRGALTGASLAIYGGFVVLGVLDNVDRRVLFESLWKMGKASD